MRRLLRRVEALQASVPTNAVMDVLELFWSTGVMPSGPAGERALAIWEASGPEDDGWRRLICFVTATGRSVADVVREEARADA